MTESHIMKLILLKAKDLSARLFRNNVGALYDRRGALVRFGVCNPGGSDCIGWTRVVVTEKMVGHTIAVFTAVEVKDEDGVVADDQASFLKWVTQAGGIALVCRSVDEFVRGMNDRG